MPILTVKEAEVRVQDDLPLLYVRENMVVRSGQREDAEERAFPREHYVGAYAAEDRAQLEAGANEYLDDFFADAGPPLTEDDIAMMQEALRDDFGLQMVTP